MKFLIFLTLLTVAHAKTDPVRKAQYEPIVGKMCLRMKYNNCSLVKAITEHESGFDPLSIGRDGAGSLGLMQVKCSTARTLDKLHGRKPITCKHLFIPQVNLKYGIEYLRYLQELLTPEPTMQEVLSAYNGGYRYIKADDTRRVKYCNAISVRKKRKCKPGELFNIEYINKVMAFYSTYGEKH